MRRILGILMVIILIWIAWSKTGKTAEWKTPDAAIEVNQQLAGDSACHRNVVGIQPYMVSTDYLSKRHFLEKIKAYFEAAKQSGYFHDNTVVLLPEYLGTWLVINDEKVSVAEAKTVTGAMAIMVLSNPIRFIDAYLKHRNESDAVAASIFRMKQESMATIYKEVFKELATTYGVTINAGSIVLPGPAVENNTIQADATQPLYNTSFVFYPNGTIDKQIVRKSFPIRSELPFVTAYPIDELPTYDLSIGKTAILVCADSWYPESYARIAEAKADVILVNSYCAGNNTMAAEWNGYDGIRMPDDVKVSDVHQLKEREAWIKYALPGRIAGTRAAIGINVFLRGELWDLGSDGQPFFVQHGKLLDIQPSTHGGLWNICLGDYVRYSK